MEIERDPMLTPVQGPAREQLGADQLAQLQKTGAARLDERRRRSLFFDGRFLAARDLTREQTYFLTRQADLSLAGGAGVVQGLMVGSPGPTTIRITPGQGITPV